MNHRPWLVLALSLLLGGAAPALEWTELDAIKRLREDQRFDEAVTRLQALGARAADDSEQFHYLQLAIDIAVESRRDFQQARALADAVRDPPRRDFAGLQVLWRFKKYDEALALAEGKPVDTWPVDCRGSAQKILGDIYRKRGNDVAAMGHYVKAVECPGAAVIVRGHAARQAGMMYLARADRAGAEAMFRKALRVSPAAYAWRNESLLALSGMLIQDSRAVEAVALFETIDFDKLDSGHWKSRLLEGYARALLAAGRKIKAIETFDRLLQSGISQAWRAKIEQELDKLAGEL